MIERRKYQSPLIAWAKERESIRKKKAAGQPAPWTDDPIFQKYRFCNVYRRHDRVSQWLLMNVLQYQAEFDDQHVFLKWVALCRWVNWPPTLALFLDGVLVTYDSIDLPTIGNTLDDRVKLGAKAWTGAYMVRAPSKREQICKVCKGSGFSSPGTGYGDVCSECGGQQTLPMSKGKFVAEVVVGGLDVAKDQLKDALSPIRPSAQKVFEVLRSVPNYGSFMAGQIVADLTYTPLLEKAHDLYTWAPKGPGSVRGYNRCRGLAVGNKPPSDQEWCEQLQVWRQELIDALGPEYDSLTLHDVQNCLCETDKYLRVANGEGRPRATYKPETEY